MGLHARLMSQACRKINKHLKRGHRCMVLFLNQTRAKIGGYGDPETTTGGNALKFYASVRFRTASQGEIKVAGKKGMRSKVKVRKTRVGVPFGECFLEITGGRGITAAYAAKPTAQSKTKDDDDGDD
jgi:recombination protein RecA